jgi:hypothetical protein
VVNFLCGSNHYAILRAEFGISHPSKTAQRFVSFSISGLESGRSGIHTRSLVENIRTIFSLCLAALPSQATPEKVRHFTVHEHISII